MYLLLVLDRSKNQLYLTQIGNSVAEDERVVILEIELNRRAERSALGKENKVLELEQALNNLVCSGILLHLDSAVVL